jgi:hypothetical protein
VRDGAFVPTRSFVYDRCSRRASPAAADRLDPFPRREGTARRRRARVRLPRPDRRAGCTHEQGVRSLSPHREKTGPAPTPRGARPDRGSPTPRLAVLPPSTKPTFFLYALREGQASASIHDTRRRAVRQRSPTRRDRHRSPAQRCAPTEGPGYRRAELPQLADKQPDNRPASLPWALAYRGSIRMKTRWRASAAAGYAARRWRSARRCRGRRCES